MQTFTPYEYLLIDVANCFGLDKVTWQERIQWTLDNKTCLEALDTDAESPILFRKAVRALRKVDKKQPTNHVMGLDATASGPQFMAVMSGCESAMRTVNLIDTGARQDIYEEVASEMSNISGQNYTRSTVKQPVMTFFYGSTAMPQQVFGNNVSHFHEAMEMRLPGPTRLMRVLQSNWKPDYEYYRWTMPDGHHVKIPVTDTVSKGIEIDEANHFRFTYKTRVISPQIEGRSLAANVVHSVDAWACRQMVRMANKQGFQLAPIHDCFFASPKYMQYVRENYKQILLEISEMNLVQNILSQINGQKFEYKKLNSNLGNLMDTMEYALS